ncbi:MAG: hypothetical protein Q9181_005200 [Wetmoreana brouardii]
MGDDRSRRVGSALSALVETLIQPSISEDDASLEERRDDALALATSIIDGPCLVQDDEDGDGGNAVRVSNLLSRLHSQPVLSQKWGILLLLHELAEGSSPGDRSGSNGPQCDDGFVHGNGVGRYNSSPRRQGPPPAFEDAFASNGLPQLPTREAPPSRSRETIGGRERRCRPSSEPMDPPLENQHETEADVGNTIKPTETSLLHDLPFTLQGLSSTHLTFSSHTCLDLPPTLPLPVVSLLHTLAEPSLLYRVLSDFVESRDEGLAGQSLRSAVGMELHSYLGLIATLEGEIRRAIAMIDPNEPRGGIGKAGVTLKRCVVWTREATMGLRLMSLMAEEAKSRKGGQLITMIHSFSASHGDPFVQAFAERMLVQVTRPFYDMLRQWIYDGELSDPYHEFFVHEQNPKSDGAGQPNSRSAPATSVWEDKYKLEEDMIPSIISEEFAKKIFLIGKSLNFIRYGCGDSAWVEAYCKDASRELRYGDTATLEASIDEAYKTTMARLIDLMDNKFHLFEHLRALKKYILLSQGDFIALLMESLASNLDRPAGSQYRHTLTAQLEHAIRGSNAQYDDPEILTRLDARLLELSHGDIGWDVFTLEYRIDAPVDVVITAWASRQYLTVFNLLWRIKRVEFALVSTWRRCMTGARGVLASTTTISKNNKDERANGELWKQARCCIAEMIHFVNQLQYYILFEVIEASWEQLQNSISKNDATLDDLIEAHTTYLMNITHKGLLGPPKSGKKEDAFSVQLHHLLKGMLAYRDAVDGLYSYEVAEFTRRQERSARAETGSAAQQRKRKGDDDGASPNPLTATQKGLLNSAARDNSSRADSPFPINPSSSSSAINSADSVLPALKHRLEDLSQGFRQKLNVLLGDLMGQSDADMKFLGTVMNFNEIYRVKRKKGGKTPHRGKEGEKSKKDEQHKDESKDEEQKAKENGRGDGEGMKGREETGAGVDKIKEAKRGRGKEEEKP